MKPFEELEVYKLARAFRLEIAKLREQLPKEEKNLLANQLTRASRSITAQIAEGHGRFHYQENIQFCRIARGSLDEVHDHLNVALDECYIEEETHIELIRMKVRIMRVLNGYIRYLKNSKKGHLNAH